MNHPLRATNRTTRPPRPRRAGLLAASLAGLLLACAPLAQADPCSAPGINAQCTEFGSIAMDSQRDIRGDAIDLTVTFTLNTAYVDQGARWILVSVRNVEDDGRAPVTIEMVRFASEYGDILTTRVEQPSANELNLWMETLDTPVGTPVTLDLRVGATERGAFQLETLVMAFDRGYAAIRDSAGNDASLFSFTLLGVNEATEASGGGGSLLPNVTPGPEATVALAALLVVALVVRRRAA